MMYRIGEGVPADGTEAVEWYRKAAMQGHADAQYLGWLHSPSMFHDSGYDGADEAVKWYPQGRYAGSCRCPIQVGHGCMPYGVGVPENDAEAVKWLPQGRHAGPRRSFKPVGPEMEICQRVKGVSEDDAEPSAYRRPPYRATAMPSTDWAVAYANGKGVYPRTMPRRSSGIARPPCRVTYADAQAQSGLDVCQRGGCARGRCRGGQVVPQAAMQGDTDAQFNWAVMYANGDECAQG